MLSASTLSSNASDAFSTNMSATTPVSPYPSAQNVTPGHNPLTELIDTEKNYMESLKIIDNQLAPLWTAPQGTDFSDLLANVRDILKANKRFCAKLAKIAANPQTIKELGDVLMQWVDDMEVPYASFSRGFIPNLNQRQDIAGNPAIRKLLQDLSADAHYEITLESLFNAPVQQLKYYKMLYGSAEPGRADHKLLLKANQRIDTVMLMAQKSSAKSASPADHVSSARLHSKALPVVTPIQTDMSSMRSELALFQSRLDCSKVVDLFSGAPTQYTAHFAATDASAILCNNFVLLPEETHLSAATRVHVVLTSEFLIVTQENTDSPSDDGTTHTLIYPPLAVNDIVVKSKMVDRELVGEYLLEVAVQNKKRLTLRADNKETRNKWVGAAEDVPSSSTLAPQPLHVVVQKHGGKPAPGSAATTGSREPRKSVIRKQDFFSFYTDQSGEISPLSSDESDTEESIFQPKLPAAPPKMEKHELKNLPAPPPPPKTASAKASPQPASPLGGGSSSNNASAPKPPAKTDPSHRLLATQPQPLDSSRLSPIRVGSPAPSIASISTHGSEESSGGSPIRPVSPRTVEISHAVAPVAMQAITQNNDYLSASETPARSASHTTKPLPRAASMNEPGLLPAGAAAATGAAAPLRTSSFHQQQQQQSRAGPHGPPAMGAQPQPHPAQKALPHGPATAYASSAPPPQQGHYAPRPAHPAQQQPMAHPAAANMPTSRSPSPGLPTPGYEQPRPPPHHLHAPPHLQPQRSMDDLNSPPRSPTPHMVNGQPNGIRQVIFSNTRCEVFHWKAESWYGVDGQCLVEVRQTYSNRSCVAIQLQQTGQLYLNAWVLPSTVICHASPTDVSISVYMGGHKENYLVHFHSPADAGAMYQILQRMHQEALKNDSMMGGSGGSVRGGAPPSNLMRSMTLGDDDGPKDDSTTVPQSLRLVMQCKTKLFVQNEHSNWSSFGSVQMKISQQLPSKRMHIEIENKSTKLVSALVQSRNVERIAPKRITFLLINEKERQSMVYMVQIKEESTGNKIFDYLKTKNAENGW